METIEISEEAMAELIKALENPPKPSERLERAAKRYLEMVERKDD